MQGIVSYGAHIPVCRLSRDAIAKAWGRPAAPGEKAVANFDEDSITMAVAACIDCLNGIYRETIDGLYVASTSFPYREKKASSLIATAIDLRRHVFTADFANSLSGGTAALRAALDAIRSGSESVRKGGIKGAITEREERFDVSLLR